MNQINYEIKEHTRGITLTEEEAYELSIMLAGEFEG